MDANIKKIRKRPRWLLKGTMRALPLLSLALFVVLWFCWPCLYDSRGFAGHAYLGYNGCLFWLQSYQLMFLGTLRRFYSFFSSSSPLNNFIYNFLPQSQLRTYFPEPLPAKEDPCQNGRERCVVSIAIYGDNPFYLEGGLRNVQLGRIYWSGWNVRFYADTTLPESYVQKLTTETSEVVIVSNMSRGKISGMFWRFFVMNDPSVDRFIVRDIDSSPSARERAALDEWVQSGRAWHVFRDSPAHRG